MAGLSYAEVVFIDFLSATQRYYAQWLGTGTSALEQPGISWVYNPQRNIAQRGYPCALDIFAYVTPDTAILSYGDKAVERIQMAKASIAPGLSPEAIGALLGEIFQVKPWRHVKYVFRGIRLPSPHPARKLTARDADLYLDFVKVGIPECKDIAWVKDYFLDIASTGYCHGALADGRLVSVTDVPDMPYMADAAREIGIHTLPAHRGAGYGKAACLSCLGEMIARNICPQWSTLLDNVASQKLAESIGFEKLFDNIAISL